MAAFFLRLYDWFATRRAWLWGALALLCAALLAGVATLGRNEDILDFLPVDNTHRKALDLYQRISQADRIVALVLPRDTAATVAPERLAEAVDRFAREVTGRDTLGAVRDLVTRIDYGAFAGIPQFLYDHIPYFLTEADYARIDSLLADPRYIDREIARNRMMLMFPTGGMLSQYVRQDPLHLFTPAVARLQEFGTTLKYELYDGYILSPDRRRAIVTMRTPYGSNETNRNARLIEMLTEAAAATQHDFPELEVHLAGAPVIAVTNARQIRSDSLRAIVIAAVLILALLLRSLRSLRVLLLIGLTILFGWLFALGCMSLIRDEVSMIILGIASIILGIAVNYPLHLLAHLRHEGNVRAALREVVSPLVVGNITTVGAFLCLVPMTAPALRDLGLFAAFMLVGTILFVLVFLPHLIPGSRRTASGEPAGLAIRSQAARGRQRRLFLLLCLLTLPLAWFSRHTAFDTEMQHINYMTETQREDLAAFQTMLDTEGRATLYVASEGNNWDEALQQSERNRSTLERAAAEIPGARLRSVTPCLPSRAEQLRRLALWNDFVARHGTQLRSGISAAERSHGFQAGAFAGFDTLLQKRFEPIPWEAFAPLTRPLFSGYLDGETNRCTVIDRLEVPPTESENALAALRQQLPEANAFDVKSMNSALANALTDDFNYIGWSCGAIVFLFLWFSFGRLELSLLAFLPMAVSWIWILGIMELTDIRFNIVNIILATFIFGQGDDYTIFITEGLIYEHAYGRRLLASYKRSIVLSALIMLIGIGTLIISRHPALRSLAEVTIIGMFAVVCMAYLIPPFIYRLLVCRTDGTPRSEPVTLVSLLRTGWYRSVLLAEMLIGGWLRIVSAGNREVLRRYRSRAARWSLGHLPGVGFHGAEIPANRDTAVMRYHTEVDLLVAAAADAVVVTDRRLRGWIPTLLRITKGLAPFSELPQLRHEKRRILFLADACPQDGAALPIGIHGSRDLFPDGTGLLARGTLTVACGAPSADPVASVAALEADMQRRCGTTRYFLPQVLNRYLYKGPEVEARVRRLLGSCDSFSRWIDREQTARRIVIVNSGQGVIGLLFALVHPDREIYLFEADADALDIARNLAALPDNLHIQSGRELDPQRFADAAWYLFRPTADQRARYKDMHPEEIA